jgi:hypothetical protein
MKKLTVGLVALAIAGSAAFATPAAAADEKEFGNAGVLAIGARTGMELSYTSTSPPSGSNASSTSVTTLSLAPQAAYFVIDGLSVGGTFLFAYSKPKDGDSVTTLGLGPAVGYNIWAVPGLLSIWPQVEILYTSASVSIANGGTAGGTTSATNTRFTLGAFVPLLIHPVKHFHFGIGPFFATDLSSSVSGGGFSGDTSKNTTLGLKGEIGGWL